ncbi:PREDICTED: apoptotic protease-activating factor 1-like isoform X2 [Trachymyrmex cornetzi]|uniref:apoptotic protease-activating factor 1-like isoform X2 n=1 Tax=Trachymyrmex cornetzi TaxID=471704 RepID=UPI00084F573C|nr:PREDICTED: apoptotic protease-activating factor 1-like isoform X2 [Trachymyrmex cornetzi]
MEKLHKDILIRLRKNVIDDLDVDNDIIQPLRNEYILTEDHIKNIYIGATKEERAAKLLDILPLCGANAFDVFHQSLKHHYDWLSDEIDIMLGNYYEIETNGVTDYYAGPLNIPPLSPLTVTREEKINQLKKALQELIPTKYIALHGMKGFGKSSLVASTLKDVKLVKHLFSNQVYWIKFADDVSLDEEILIQLNTLYYDVRNLEIQPELFTSLERNSLIQYLKCYFNKKENCNALLILDDVHNEQIINTFDFQCKTLVLTDNIDVVLEKRPKIIEMNDGFTEIETLGLFAKALEMDVKKLPVEAKRIYEECKGMPLLIAMFAAQFEEFKCDMRIHDRRWKYYLRSLREKSRTNKVMNEFWKKQETIFDICIKQLKPDLKKYYEDLAIFCEDVNIASKTLEIFWRKDTLEVEELMLDLCHKSLAARIWNNDLKTYIYGVHDLLLTHLRKKRTDDELVQMHKSIIEKYGQYCNNDFSKLPDDNYIYLYIGYHLEQAKLFEEFPHLYLNFDFIQAKLTHAGLNDLLLDLRKYRKYITLNSTDEYVVKVSDLERFLQEQASVIIEHKHKKCLDIIQIAMNHSSQDYITQTAKDLAMRRQEFLYLSHKKSSQHANIALTEEIPRNICTSSFTHDPELVLTGNTSGKIILCDFQGTQRKIFNGHGEKCSIKKIIVSMAGDCFLSLSSAGIIKLFSLSEESDEFYQNYMNIGSPRQKQNFWSDPYSNLKGQDDSLAEFKVKNEIILDMAFGREENYIAACTNKATIQIWDRNGNTMFTLTDPKYQYIMKMAFTTDASLLHIMDESKGAFFVFTNSGNDYTTYQYVTCYNLQLKSASKEVIFFHHVPMHDDSLIVVTKKEAMYVKWCRRIENCVYNFNRKLKGYIDEKVTYVCATITYDGEYLILADSAGFINVWNTDSGFQPVAIYKSRVISLDSFWFKDCHVICGSGNGALYRWKLPIQESSDLPRKCLFDAIVSCDEMDIVVKETPSKIITMSCGEEMIKESELIKGEISNLQLSANGNKALYVIDNKIIELLDIRTGIITEVLEVDKPIQFVKIVNLFNRDVILCRWEDDNLKIWQPPVVFGIKTRGEESIHNIHLINDNCVITVLKNGEIKIWYTSIPWQLISQVDLSNPPSNIIFSCLSYNQKYLAILNESHRLTLLYINYENIAASLPHIQINEQPHFTHSFAQKAICCDISKNEHYIAVGLESGQISIINIQKRMEITQLFFDANPITQLCWAPVTIDVPILLSLTSDELIWWNIALAKDNMIRTQNLRSRISRSTSAPSFSSNAFWNQRVPNSRSVDVGVSRMQDEMISSSDIVNNISSYWKNKKGKNPEIPELLTVVALPQNRDGKICISPDFAKYIMVDMYGSINTFELIDYREFILNIS